MRHVKFMALTLIVVGLIFEGSSAKPDAPSTVDAHSTNSVDVGLSDFTNLPDFGWAVNLSSSTVPEGDVFFDVTNINTGAPDVPHNLVVIKSDLPPDQLPKLGPGLGVDESQVDVIGSTQFLFSGGQAELEFELDEGNYVLICNVNPLGVEFNAHYEDGMFVGFTVLDDDDDY